MAEQNAQSVCPHCGYCPHCGRSNPTPAAPYPYPSPLWPWWQQPHTHQAGNSTRTPAQSESILAASRVSAAVN